MAETVEGRKAMDCPVCKNAMITLELSEVEIDYCPGCGGIWLDKGELELLLDDAEKAGNLLDSFKADSACLEKPRKCPICMKKMAKIVVGEEAPVLLIDKCVRGDGLWFDKGELEEIIKRAKLDKDNKIQQLLADMFGTKHAGITKKNFGSVDGREAHLYTLTSAGGLTAEITNYGGIVKSLYVPDRNGKARDIVLGYETVGEYIKDTPYFGAIVGRYANRIAEGKFTLKGIKYTLAVNNGPNHLHGGLKGFDKVLWQAEPMTTEEGPALKLTYTSSDGEEGYPGNLVCTVIYTLTNNNELKISYQARTDKATVINLTNHSYFNLAGHDSGDILGHEATFNAEYFTPVTDTLIPTGAIEPVADTGMDFTKPMTIGSRIEQVGGYDHNYIIKKQPGEFATAATIYEPQSGRVMEVLTDQPGFQFYTGNFLDGSNKGKGAVYNKHAGFCIETQHYPDSPNKPQFPSVVLEASEKYEHLTVYKFSVK